MIVEGVIRVEAVCKNTECTKAFTKKKSNQIYCSDECCQIVTNKRLMVKYHENRARLAGKERICSECEETKLSRYNASTVCNLCKARQRTLARNELLEMISGS